MATSQAIAAQNHLEDPLAHLPCSRIVQHKKGQFIYQQGEPSANIYLVIDGRVTVARLAPDGRQTIVAICQTDDFFGESALLGLAHTPEQAAALNDTRVMSWTATEIDNIVQSRPRLATALLQIVVQRSLEYGCRIESFSTDTADRRLARSLIGFSQKAGAPESDGSYRLPPFTHELLGRYVGTSREVVTLCMNVFRKQGYLRYSRQGIVLFRDALNEWLRQTPTHEPKVRRAQYAAAGGHSAEMAILKRA